MRLKKQEDVKEKSILDNEEKEERLNDPEEDPRKEI